MDKAGRSVLLGVGLAMSLTSPARGQEGAPALPPPKAFCFRGRPATRCRSFLLTESTLNTEWARFELGAMHNVGTRSAVGGTVLLRPGPGDSTAFGAKARYRRWLSRTVALDVSTGILFSGPGTAPGFAGHVGAMVWDEVGFSIEAETIPPDFPEPRRLGWSASLRLGAHAGLVAGALVALLAAVCCVD